MKNENTMKLFMLFISLIALWVTSTILHATILWFIIINLIAIYIIYKYKTFSKNDIIIGFILGALCMPSNFIMGMSAILPYIASMMIFGNCQNKIFLFENKKRNNFLITIVLIFVFGGILGGINVFFAMGSMTINPSFELKWIFDAVRAGVFEEIFFRLFFFALCVYITNDQQLSRFQNVLCYAIMVIPHVLIHFKFETFNIGNLIMLSVLFGIPFAFMQRKSNLVSAMGSHAFVDMIRFCVFGM